MKLTPEYQEKAEGMFENHIHHFESEHQKRCFLRMLAEWSALIIPDAFEAGGARMHDDLSGYSIMVDSDHGPPNPDLDQFTKKIIQDD